MSRLRAALALIRPREIAVSVGRCPFCGPTMFVRLRNDEIGIRCVRCGASAVHLSIGWALKQMSVDLRSVDVYELSARGPVVDYLSVHARSLATSEYFSDFAPGDVRDGIRCEDVQRLTYTDASFDLVTHTEVFEHVPDDARAFLELHRVLKAGGNMVFTVPLTDRGRTVERARMTDGVVENLLPPSFHTDPLRGGEPILVYRDYGADIVDRVNRAGFDDVILLPPSIEIPWRMGRRVIVARRLR
jgi:SAM-dependent methyltransferase